MKDTVKVKIGKNGKAMYFIFSTKAMRSFRISKKEADERIANGADTVEKFFYER